MPGLSPAAPVSAAQVATGTRKLGDVMVSGAVVYWSETRPEAGGATTVVRWSDGTATDVTPPGMSVRDRVHEYGGAAFCVLPDSLIVSNAEDNQLWRVARDDVQPLTASPGLRFADMVHDPERARLICVAEEHEGDRTCNRLVAVGLSDGSVHTLAQGRDFYAAPRLRRDGGAIAWLEWDLPHMPWDEAELWSGAVTTDGEIAQPRRRAGGGGTSALQPRWAADGSLYCVDDSSGRWNLSVATPDGVRIVFETELECGVPPWTFGTSSYALFEDGSAAVCGCREGLWEVWVVPPVGAPRRVPVRFTAMGQAVHAVGPRLLTDAASATEAASLALIDLDTGADEVIWTSAPSVPAADVIPLPRSLTFPTQDGSRGHAFLYLPATEPDRAPPLIVHAHGGPTSAARPVLSLETCFWTSRGFALLDVNYGGSTGYGRAYRDRLHWLNGCIDVDDCVAAAREAARQGLCDPDRMVITGGSAGGYVALAALVFHPTAFAGATSYYGITDLETLAASSHKFESGYFDWLIGPLETERSLYHNRSPLNLVSRIERPVLVIQGSEDTVVPPEQARRLVAELDSLGVPHRYLELAGEGHGLRSAEAIETALEAELSFYTEILA